MQIFTKTSDLRTKLQATKATGKRIGLVPTMGALHLGHLSLIEKIRIHCDQIVVTIFVNPLQFHNKSDFENYPNSIFQDQRILREYQVDYLFSPGKDEIYPGRNLTRLSVNDFSERFEGRDRPGHFEGVATVVAKLFNIVQPDVAIFGEKDFQQLRLIEQIVSDLHFPIEILRGEIVREQDGLAMSSRNVRLSIAGRAAALVLSKAIKEVLSKAAQGERDAAKLCSYAGAMISAEKLAKLRYAEIVDSEGLNEVDRLRPNHKYRLLLAAEIEAVRLIDNSEIYIGDTR